MQQKLYLACLLSVIISMPALAQSGTSTTIQFKEIPITSDFLPYNSPLEDRDMASTADSTSKMKMGPSGIQREVMQRIAGIYRIHVKSMEAQLRNDPLQAEKYITNALSQLQKLLDKYPEVQSDQRFSEVYRSVMTEYRKFYGITGNNSGAKGEIFAIRKELYSGNDDWMKESYSVPKNLPLNRTEVPLVQNQSVNRHLMYFSMRRPEVMEHWLKRSEKYFPMMRRIFREEGVPTELIHLSMVESGLNPRAESWASAVGMWQFIQSTGSMYGLEVNWWVDERRDPVKATRAAARHLKDLYEVWGDWHLAMAGYNISPRGLNSAIRQAGEKNYWEASPYLPRETRNYVPGFIAATMIEMNPRAFGFKQEYGTEAYDYDVYRVAPLMPLDRLAKAAGITLEKLKDLNPELLRWATPPGGKYPLKLPAGSRARFAANYKQIPKDERGNNIAMHTVERGETLGYIAQRYGTSVRALFETNENLSSTIYPGQKIVVPLAPGSTSQLADNRSANEPGQTSSDASGSQSSSDSEPSGKARVRYQVKSGDTIGHIAEWFDVDASQIRAWNNTSNTIYPGEYLTLYVPDSDENYYQKVDDMSFTKKQQIERQQQAGKEVQEAYLASSESGEYTVQPNDTLIDIANAYGVSVSRLKQLNNLDNSRIYVGQKLIIGTTN